MWRVEELICWWGICAFVTRKPQRQLLEALDRLNAYSKRPPTNEEVYLWEESV